MKKIKEKIGKYFSLKIVFIVVISIIIVLVFNLTSSFFKVDENEFGFDGQYLHVETNTVLDSYKDLVMGKNEVATLTNVLKDDYITDQTLVLRTNFLFMNVYADDELIYSYIEETSDVFFPQYAKSQYHSIELPDAVDDLEITIEFISGDVFSNYYINAIYVGNLGAISFAIVKSTIMFIALVFFVIITLVIVATLFVNYYNTNYKMKTGIISATIVSLVWACSDFGLGQLTHGFYLIDYYLAIISVFILHIVYARMLIPFYWNSKKFKVVFLIQHLFLILVAICFFTKTLPLQFFLKYNYLNFIIVICYFLHLNYIYHKNNKKYDSMRTMCLMFSCIVVIELLYLVFFPAEFNTSIILLFIGVFNMFYIKIYFADIADQEKNKKELELKLSDAQTKLLITEIKPHFLYNALNSIRALCSIDVELAKKTINNLAKYFRSNTDSLNSQRTILFEKELEHIRSYISIEQVRFGEKIKYIEDIKCFNFYVPSLSVEPLVENAVAHGLSKKRSVGTVIVKTYDDKQNFYIEVNDDGLGFDVLEKRNPSSIGLNNSEQRVKIFSKGKIIVSSEVGNGTSIKIVLPKHANNYANKNDSN